MSLVLSLVLVFVVVAVGFAATGTYTDTWSGSDVPGGIATLTTDAELVDITSVTISWNNAWAVAYTWTATTVVSGDPEPYAWVATVDTTGSADDILFNAVNDSTRAKTVTATWADATTAPSAYGLVVTSAGAIDGDGEELGYQGSATDESTCTLTLAETTASGAMMAGEALYSLIPSDLSLITLGTMTFTVT